MKQPSDASNERELLARIEQQDELALRQLHGLYGRRIFAFAMRLTRNADEAETVVSDTLMEIWKNPARFRQESKLSTWLLGIARNKALMSLRARAPQHDELDEQLPDADLGSFEIFANQELRDGLLRCMEALSALHRECLHLVFFEELSLKEVAQLQGCEEATARTRLFYARRNVKDCVSALLA